MSNKYDKVLTDLLSRFNSDDKVDDHTRNIVRQVMNAEINKLDMQRPHKIKEEIKEIIEREAQQLMKNMQ